MGVEYFGNRTIKMINMKMNSWLERERARANNIRRTSYLACGECSELRKSLRVQ